jgi:CII-binding regulator of phage lambda lysogenization HflD
VNTEIINLYVDRLLNEVTEGVKSRILLETQLKYTESLNAQLQTKINELEKQIEKLNNKKSKKEVNTSDDQF